MVRYPIPLLKQNDFFLAGQLELLHISQTLYHRVRWTSDGIEAARKLIRSWFVTVGSFNVDGNLLAPFLLLSYPFRSVLFQYHMQMIPLDTYDLDKLVRIIAS